VSADDKRGSPDAGIEPLIEAIADGAPLAWNDAARRPGDPILRDLHVIAKIAAVHRELPDERDTSAATAAPAAAGRPDLAKAERWGPLLLLERIGGGSFGEVYRAWDPALDHEVALKLLRFPARTDSPEATSSAAVVREGQLLARVRHPNVITVHGAREVNGQVGIWTEFLRGRTLERVIQDEGPMSAEEASVVADSLCRALAAVHHGGLLHRDIKASNVMRAAGGRIVLLDFGTGSELALSSPASSRRIVGTPLYLAPELFEGAAASPASDIYSLGVLLFYLVTGTHPVTGKSLEEIRQAHRSGRRVLLSDVRADLPRSFVHIVERALSPHPGGRYPSAGALAGDLTAASPRGAAAGAAESPARPRRATPVLVAAAVLGSGLLLMALGYVTSGVFNLHHGITSDFSVEGPLDYLQWGGMNVVPTLFYMGAALFLFYAANAVARLIVVGVPAAGRPVNRLRDQWRALVRRGGLDDAGALAKTICAAGVLALVGISMAFRDVLNGFTASIDTSPIETLSILHPSFVYTHALFGLSLDMLLLLLMFGLVQVLRASRGPIRRVPPGPVVGIVALAGMTLLFHAFSWRVLWQNEFRQVRFDGHVCYALARRGGEVLVHCPQRPAPRNRVVQAADPRLQMTDRIEKVSIAFTPGRGRGL
jgi:tRNA A-37 threonylcarbamoyl transferase component Bud32